MRIRYYPKKARKRKRDEWVVLRGKVKVKAYSTEAVAEAKVLELRGGIDTSAVAKYVRSDKSVVMADDLDLHVTLIYM